MDLAQHYHAILGIHILAVVAFVAGTLLVASMLPSVAGAGAAPERQAVLGRLRSWNRLVTTPAMIVTWVFGLMLATAGGWFVAVWLQAKLALVLVLSALHGMQSARLRRLQAGDATVRRPTLRPALAVMLLTAGILILVGAKPW